MRAGNLRREFGGFCLTCMYAASLSCPAIADATARIPVPSVTNKTVQSTEFTVDWVKKTAATKTDESLGKLKSAYKSSRALSAFDHDLQVPGEILWSLYDLRTTNATLALQEIVIESLGDFTNGNPKPRYFELMGIALELLNRDGSSNSVALARRIYTDQTISTSVRQLAYYNCLCAEIKQQNFPGNEAKITWLTQKYTQEVADKSLKPDLSKSDKELASLVFESLETYFSRSDISLKPDLEKAYRSEGRRSGESAPSTQWLKRQINEVGTFNNQWAVRFWLPEFATNFPGVL